MDFKLNSTAYDLFKVEFLAYRSAVASDDFRMAIWASHLSANFH